MQLLPVAITLFLVPGTIYSQVLQYTHTGTVLYKRVAVAIGMHVSCASTSVTHMQDIYATVVLVRAPSAHRQPVLLNRTVVVSSAGKLPAGKLQRSVGRGWGDRRTTSRFTRILDTTTSQEKKRKKVRHSAEQTKK